MIVEIGKNYLKKFYDGNLQEAIKAHDYIEWTQERIKNAFAVGNGTEKDFKRYMENNRQFAVFTTI